MHLLYTAKVEWSSKNMATQKKLCSLDLCCCWRAEDGFQNVALLGPRVGGHMGIRHASNDSEQMLGISFSVNATRKHMQDWSYMIHAFMILHDMNNGNGFLQGRCHDMKSWKIHWFVWCGSWFQHYSNASILTNHCYFCSQSSGGEPLRIISKGLCVCHMFFFLKIDIPHANKSLSSFRFGKWNEICHQNMG